MTELKPLTLHPDRPDRFYVVPCRKCGHEEPMIEWRDRMDLDCKSTGWDHDVEHFDVTCLRCGYAWSEPLER